MSMVAFGVTFADPGLEESVRGGLDSVERALQQAVRAEDEFVANVASHLMDAGGKRFRPLVTLLASHFGDPTRSPDGRPELVVRYLTPHSKWSIHSEYQENLHMLTLFRGGPVIWMSPRDAERIGAADNEWIEAYNRNGVVACRAVVTHRMPEGTVFMYHTMDRHLNVPRTETSGLHGGGDNSLTRLLIKPTHLIGGYAQLSWGFNYYGPTGPQRDQLIIVRKRRSEVVFA